MMDPVLSCMLARLTCQPAQQPRGGRHPCCAPSGSQTSHSIHTDSRGHDGSLSARASARRPGEACARSSRWKRRRSNQSEWSFAGGRQEAGAAVCEDAAAEHLRIYLDKWL